MGLDFPGPGDLTAYLRKCPNEPSPDCGGAVSRLETEPLSCGRGLDKPLHAHSEVIWYGLFRQDEENALFFPLAG